VCTVEGRRHVQLVKPRDPPVNQGDLQSMERSSYRR
jgi:hypothetical protein